MNGILRGLLELGSPAGPRARLSVVIFHRVLPQPDPLFPGEVDAARFATICGWLKDWFQVLPLDEAVSRLAAGTLPARALAITFDDGYADNRHVALPILQRHGLPATVFVATGFLDGGCMWNDRVIEAIRRTKAAHVTLRGALAAVDALPLGTVEERRAAIASVIGAIKYLPPPERLQAADALCEQLDAPPPTDLMMTSDEVVQLRRAGMQIGAHTVSHPILARLGRDEARREIEQSKHTLESLLGERVGLFAYPNGKPGEDYSPQSVALAREVGFDAAVSTAWGAARRSTDPFQIPRFTPWDRSRPRFGARMISNLWN